MDNIIEHNFGGFSAPEQDDDKKTEEILSEDDQKIVSFVRETTVSERLATISVRVLFDKSHKIKQAIHSVVGWGKNPGTLALRREVIARLSDVEVIEEILNSDIPHWTGHPSYYFALIQRFDTLRQSGKLLDILAKAQAHAHEK